MRSGATHTGCASTTKWQLRLRAPRARSAAAMVPRAAAAGAPAPAPLVVFTTPGCPYCSRAKDALAQRGLRGEEVDVSRDAALRAALADAAGARTVPQIWVGSAHVGGADALAAALADGSFDALLARVAEPSGGTLAALPAQLRAAVDQARAAAAATPDAVAPGSSGAAALPPDLVRLAAALADGSSGIRAAAGSGAGGERTFSGAQLLDWLAAHEGLSSGGSGGGGSGSPAAVGARLLAAHMVVRVADGQQPGGAALAAVQPEARYCLRGDAPRSVEWGRPLNTAYWWATPARPAADVAEDLRGRMLALYDRHLSPDGRSVAYTAMRGDPQFWAYVDATAELQRVDLAPLGRDELTAFALNAYNALIIHALVVHGPDKYRSPATRSQFFSKAACYDIGGQAYTADDLENGVLRSNRPGAAALGMLLGLPSLSGGPFKAADPRRAAVVGDPVDARIHFALVCGARSCPPVRIYSAANLEEGLQGAAEAYCASDVEIDVAARRVTLSKLFKWYWPDFGDTKAARLRWLLPHLPSGTRAQLAGLLEEDPAARRIAVVHREYDWTLNGE